MKYLFASLAALISCTSFAKSDQVISRRAVLEQIAVTPDNGGINPEFAAVKISARVMLGGNACTAQGLSAKMLVRQGQGGNRYVSAIVSGRQPTDLICPMNYDPVYADVSTTVRDRVGFMDTTYLVNAYEEGLNVSLTRFSQCHVPVRCTREYNPQVCEYQGLTFHESNPCMTIAKVKAYACVAGLDFDETELICSSIVPLR